MTRSITTPGCVAACVAALAAAGLAAPASAQEVSVTIENLNATDGLFLTPTWFGFHNGSFDLYDLGSAASTGLERIAEDGNFGPLAAEFDTDTGNAGQSGVLFGTGGFGSAAGQPPLIDPGEIVTSNVTLDMGNRFFTFASMVIPSNDAFIGLGDSLEVYDAGGVFQGTGGTLEVLILGSQVLDAGTEVNDEMEAAFINQTGPDMGNTEGGVVGLHPGFIGSVGNPGGTPIILGGTNAAGLPIDSVIADFTRAGHQVARVTITEVPEPASASLAALGALTLLRRRRAR